MPAGALQEVRTQYPQYNDMSDQDLSRALIERYPEQYTASLSNVAGYAGRADPATAGLPEGFKRAGRQGDVETFTGPENKSYTYNWKTGQTSEGTYINPATAGLPAGHERVGSSGGWEIIAGPGGSTYDYNVNTGEYRRRAPGDKAPPGVDPNTPSTAPTTLPPQSAATPPPASLTGTKPATLGPAKASELDLEPLTPQEKAYLEQVYGEASESGRRALTEAANDAAAARGFSISDSPIGNAYLDEVSQMESAIAADRAGSALSLGREGRQLRESSRQFDVGEQSNRWALEESARQAQAQLDLATWQEQEAARQFQEAMTLSRGQFTEAARQAQEGLILARADLTEKQRQFDTVSQQWAAEFGEGQRQFDVGAGQWNSQFGEAQRQFDETAGLARAGFTEQSQMNRLQAAENMRQFDEGLKQQDFVNLLNLSGSINNLGATASGGGGGGGATGTTPGGTELSNTLTAYLNTLSDRFGGQTATSNYYPGGMDYWKMINSTMSSLGDLASGASSMAAASTARVKKDIEPYDQDEYDAALAKLRETPITRWRYLGEPSDGRYHTGPILELSPEEIRLDDTYLDMLSYAGLQHAGLKALDRKVNRLTELLMEEAA